MITDFTNQVLTFQRLHHSAHLEERRAAKRLFRVLEKKSLIILYEYPVKTNMIDEELAGDVLLSIQNRVPKILLNFTYRGVSFENFLKRVSYMQTRMFCGRRKHALRKDLALSLSPDALEELIVSEDAPDHTQLTFYRTYQTESSWSLKTEPCRKLKEQMKRSNTLRKRFLQLVIHCADSLTAHQISFLASFLEIDELELAELMRRAREMAIIRRGRLEHLRRIRNLHYFDVLINQQEYIYNRQITRDPEILSEYRIRYERSLKQFRNRSREIQQKTNPITHEILGNLTGVPKGTVDSGMHALKRYLREIVDG
jgi:hypothetical protein